MPLEWILKLYSIPWIDCMYLWHNFLHLCYCIVDGEYFFMSRITRCHYRWYCVSQAITDATSKRGKEKKDTKIIPEVCGMLLRGVAIDFQLREKTERWESEKSNDGNSRRIRVQFLDGCIRRLLNQWEYSYSMVPQFTTEIFAFWIFSWVRSTVYKVNRWECKSMSAVWRYCEGLKLKISLKQFFWIDVAYGFVAKVVQW